MVKQKAKPPELRANDIFHMLADPTRRAILMKLGQGPARVTEVADPFEMSLPAISRHIRLMEQAGLLERKVRGREHILALRPEPLAEAADLIKEMRSYWTGTLESLDRYFQKKTKSLGDSAVVGDRKPSKTRNQRRRHA